MPTKAKTPQAKTSSKAKTPQAKTSSKAPARGADNSQNKVRTADIDSWVNAITKEVRVDPVTLNIPTLMRVQEAILAEKGLLAGNWRCEQGIKCAMAALIDKYANGWRNENPIFFGAMVDMDDNASKVWNYLGIEASTAQLIIAANDSDIMHKIGSDLRRMAMLGWINLMIQKATNAQVENRELTPVSEHEDGIVLIPEIHTCPDCHHTHRADMDFSADTVYSYIEDFE